MAENKKEKSTKTRDVLLAELEKATKQLQEEKAAKKRDAKIHAENIKDCEAVIDDILSQLENPA